MIDRVDEVVRWCSLFCTGNPAIGDLTVPISDEDTVDLPVCEDCLHEVQKDPVQALATITGL